MPMQGALAAICLGFAATIASATAVTEDTLTDVQMKALDLSLEEYHNKEHVHNAFKVASIQETMETEFSQGTFVRLQFALVQTTCSKNQWQKKDCKTTKRSRRQNCITCFKIEPESLEVVSQYVDCLPEQLLRPEREEARRERCNEVKIARETGLGFPGSFSFSRTKSAP
ncbi:retinoic acid receptor responder protein 2-like [Rhinatrema bivittatum]|uniref:retinoic acid receptor responder protein 2-like n=1 Tax=Rhinatrema bivittatum TaxID=194408 RepID=UPI00112C365E|nr:retinoic acid receptor responder protein 2-like [Rhinatrema bivittatum]